MGAARPQAPRWGYYPQTPFCYSLFTFLYSRFTRTPVPIFMHGYKKAAELRVNALIRRLFFYLFHFGLLGKLSNTGKPGKPSLLQIFGALACPTVYQFRCSRFTFSGLLSKPSKPNNMSKPSNPSLLR